MFEQRLARLRARLSERELDGILISGETNVRYLTGFTGDSAYALVTPDAAVVLCDRRYEEQLAAECPQWQHRIRGPAISLLDFTVQELAGMGKARLGFEQEHLSYQAASSLYSGLKDIQLAACSGDVERLRMVKDADELKLIRTAIAQAEEAYRVVCGGLRSGDTELEISWRLEDAIRRAGGSGCSFPPIVAADGHAALPHATPRREPLAGHSLLLVDWGALNQGYASDLTRVIALGPPSEKLREVHRIVHEAQAAAFAAVRSGVPRADIDRAARDVIRGHGYGDCFSHALGHGIGRQVHEVPRLAEGQTELLEAGMVITLEPGIYLPGWGGVRLEDDILVTDHGAERLSSLPLDLEAQTVIW